MKKLLAISLLCAIIAAVAISCQGEAELEFKRHYSGGMALYQTHCQNCHGQKGEGLSALIPTLTDTVYIKKNKNKLACIVNNGMSGMITVSGRFYDGQMPPSGFTPIDIAKVLTYVGNSFGNNMGLIDVTQVEKDLKDCK